MERQPGAWDRARHDCPAVVTGDTRPWAGWSYHRRAWLWRAKSVLVLAAGVEPVDSATQQVACQQRLGLLAQQLLLAWQVLQSVGQ